MSKGYNLVLNEIFDVDDLDFVDIGILIFLKKHMFNNKNICWVSIKTIAKHAKLSYVTVLHRLHSLAQKGYIAIRSGAKAGTTNVYEMIVDFFNTLSSGKKGSKKENKMTSQDNKSYYNNTKEKAYQAMYAGNSQTRNYDINMLEQQLLKHLLSRNSAISKHYFKDKSIKYTYYYSQIIILNLICNFKSI